MNINYNIPVELKNQIDTLAVNYPVPQNEDLVYFLNLNINKIGARFFNTIIEPVEYNPAQNNITIGLSNDQETKVTEFNKFLYTNNIYRITKNNNLSYGLYDSSNTPIHTITL